MVTTFCLYCEDPINLGSRPTEGQMVTCSNCGAQLEVLNLDPLELDWAYLEPITDDTEWDWKRKGRHYRLISKRSSADSQVAYKQGDVL
jgi:lysine biosynthesis protein LysW